jgi:glycosyltransferase involved in cell wall biosynthesis
MNLLVLEPPTPGATPLSRIDLKTERMSQPLVTVVLPTYNRPEFLVQAVQTVSEQTYESIELVIVDDHSSTPAREVLAAESITSSLRINHQRHDTNRGANAARNTGIRCANGQFIAFLDDDDEWAPEKIERQVETFQRTGDDTGVVYTWIEYVYGSTGEKNTKTSTISGDVTEKLLTGESVAEFSAIMVRSDVVDEAGLPDERFASWQDRDWYIRLSRHCEFHPVKELLTVRHMDHGDQITSDFETKRDVSFPLFVKKHRSLASEYGLWTEREFLGEHTRMLGWSAVRNGYYGEARRLFVRSLMYYPLAPQTYLYLFASAGGERTHHLAKRLQRLPSVLRS